MSTPVAGLRRSRIALRADRFARMEARASHGGVLRDVVETDLQVFFEQQRDREAAQVAAFVARDRDAFDAHWRRLLRDASITKQTILDHGLVAGNIVAFEQHGKPMVGYWLGREYWGRGLATKALSELLERLETRPLYARAATSNVASIRVLEKCGFAVSGVESSFDDALGRDLEEALLVLA